MSRIILNTYETDNNNCLPLQGQILGKMFVVCAFHTFWIELFACTAYFKNKTANQLFK